MFYRIGNVIKMHDDPYLQLLDDLYRHIIESRNSAVDDELSEVCAQCKFAHDLNVKLYSCDDDMESLVYCDKHEVMCRAQRHACDWAAL